MSLDAVIRDQIKDGFHMGDHLHGSDAAYVAMARSIDLSLLR